MSLTPEQKRQREGRVTAGFCPYLMAGRSDRILQEWMRLVGHEALEEPDPGTRWDWLFGSVVEPVALAWHEGKTGVRLLRCRSEQGKSGFAEIDERFAPRCEHGVITHPDRPYVSATLDSWREEDKTVIDCKAWSSWQKIDYICSFLAPQIIVQRACTGASGGALLIVHGGAEPAEYPIVWTPEYEQVLWDRVDEFWRCCMDLVPPIAMPEELPKIETTKTYDMRESNAWASYASVWLETYSASKAFATATEELKALVPGDAGNAHGHGVAITRSKKGALTIKGIKK